MTPKRLRELRSMRRDAWRGSVENACRFERDLAEALDAVEALTARAEQAERDLASWHADVREQEGRAERAEALAHRLEQERDALRAEVERLTEDRWNTIAECPDCGCESVYRCPRCRRGDEVDKRG